MLLGELSSEREPALSVMRHRLVLLLILLIATVLRFYGLNNLSPPGLEHDEVANWLIDRAILDGHHSIYFTAAYGHEAGFHYVQALFVALLGDHALALRLPAAFIGVLVVAVTYTLARRLFGREVALMAAALLAVLFWPVFYSRLALRAIMLPLLSALSAYFWWGAWRQLPVVGNRKRPLFLPWNSSSPVIAFGLAGLFAGLSFHTYMAGRAVPIFYGLFLIYLAFFHRSDLKRHGSGVILFWLVYAVVAAPLVVFLLANPGAEFRIGEVDAPLRALWSGNWQPVLLNCYKILGMFGFRGDPLWRQGVANAPVFEPVTATFFYLSLLLCLWRLRDSRYAFLLLWLGTSSIPSIVTIDAPSTIRIINALPVITVLPLLLIHNFTKLSTVISRLSTGYWQSAPKVLLSVLVLYHAAWTVVAIYRTWPRNNEVQFVWQAALTEAAAYLDRSQESGPAAIGGWSPDTVDPHTMYLSLRRDDLRLSYFNPEDGTLIIPTAVAGEAIRIVHPIMLPLDSVWQKQLMIWKASISTIDSFTLYRLSAVPAVHPDYPFHTSFGSELLFLGYDVVEPCSAQADSHCGFITYWRVMASIDDPQRLFLHLLDEDGNLLAEDYRLDMADPQSLYIPHWQPGDLILQHHNVKSVPEVPTFIRLGLFDPYSCVPGPCQNRLTQDGSDYILLPASP